MEPGEITQLLRSASAGDPGATALLIPMVYAKMHMLAKSYLRNEGKEHILQPTALVNEAYMRLFGADEPVNANDRGHFSPWRQRRCVGFWWTTPAAATPASETASKSS